ncbi:PPOX class F420-dependent oxidoreductase [Halovivax cerinus]|uniref:PPOX class F420-dependent oxidoreductase n=1 Tax=Halovivax cerinus TaxID=1487865 RepID=A0ABD5NU05_9EURY|nr:PPOX class F420-dependent oxidoreductase [Halovivax cerinus]
MESIPADATDLFEKRTFAHLTTLFPDGSPHATPVWIGYDEAANRLLVNTERDRQKEKNVRADPRVALSMTDPDDPYRMLSVTGEVDELTTDGAREHADELAGRYTGTAAYPSPIETERIIMRIRPDTVRYGGD